MSNRYSLGFRGLTTTLRVAHLPPTEGQRTQQRRTLCQLREVPIATVDGCPVNSAPDTFDGAHARCGLNLNLDSLAAIVDVRADRRQPDLIGVGVGTGARDAAQHFVNLLLRPTGIRNT